MKLPAPAKVNLHLRILGRRPDGFHEIETLMAPLTLADDVSVEITEGGSEVEVTCDLPEVPTGSDNLAAAAVRKFARATGRTFSARIHIEKRIPMGAGLGGGSSDAASVLIALDKLFETRLGIAGLEELAAPLGSDVPFFIRGVPALCRGRGERIEPHPLPERLPLLLLKPEFGVETPWAYRQWAEARVMAPESEIEQDLGGLTVFNSLERPVFEKFLLLPTLKRWLLNRPEVRVAAMSGSGSTMFAVLHDSAMAPALREAVTAAFGPLWLESCETF